MTVLLIMVDLLRAAIPPALSHVLALRRVSKKWLPRFRRGRTD